ncbi:13859_t:CDS:2 [Cetraspora pellucida]|uniref:13859_t:CDS:1 n=1 Tax=Cetraspora pellucida TaxID=1433469 RepID=A0A9N9HZG2_9GLOM|nr:13859_t:CDS:2 [Cetraspora pellucida]
MSAKKQKSKDHTDSNAISNSDTNPKHNDTFSNELLNRNNISMNLDIITDHSNETSDIDHSNKNNNPNCSNKKPNKKVPNGQRECGQLVKTQDSTSNEELNLTNMATIFDEEKKENIVNVDKELEIIITANGDNWEHDKAIDFLQEKYDLLSIGNESIISLVNVEQNKNQISLFQ